MTVHDLSQLYLAKHLAGRSSHSTTKRLLRNTFGLIDAIFVNDLTPRQVLEWYSTLTRTPYQANRALGVLRSMIRWGMRLELCQRDPTGGVQRTPVDSRSRFLSQEEVDRLLKTLTTAEHKIALLIRLILATGCRRGEVQQARWIDFDLTQRTWTKPRTKGQRWHIVPLPSQLIPHFHHHPRRNEWLFTGADAGPWSLAGIEKAWAKVRHTANLPGVRFHDLRRTAASHMAIHGENLSVIQKLLDHSSLQATAIYARLNLSALTQAIQRNADRLSL